MQNNINLVDVRKWTFFVWKIIEVINEQNVRCALGEEEVRTIYSFSL